MPQAATLCSMTLELPDGLADSLRDVISTVGEGMSPRHREIVLTAAALLVAIEGLPALTPDELRVHRKVSRVTQGQLAEMAGVVRMTVQRWESGDTGMPVWLTPIVLELRRRSEVTTPLSGS